VIRRAAAFALVALLCWAGTATGVAAPQPNREGEQKRPNIVVVMTDDQTLESMRVMDGVRRTLGEEGTTFERAFVSNPLCCPSRATLFTGQYSHNHGVIGNTPPDGGYGRLDKTEWLPIWLQGEGYRTVHIGKFLNRYGVDSPPTEVPPGWTEWYGSVDPSTYRFYGYTLNENGILNTYGADRNPLFYSTDYYAARARSVIQRMGDTRTPFFLSVAFLAPHSGGPRDADDPPRQGTPSPAPRHVNRFAGEPVPFGPAFNEADVSDKPSFIQLRPPIGAARARAIEENYRQRLESLLAVDEAVVGLVDSLRAERELDNTLIVFTSDNGFFHGEHRLPNGKVLVYEPSIRVPLLMRGPGVPEGARRRQLVTNADLAPTILEAAGAKPGLPQDGRSLFGLMEDRGLEWGRDLLIEGAPGVNQPAYDALRTYRYVYVQYANGERELYDLERDPDQLTSLHNDPAYARVQADLALRLELLSVCRGRACRARPPARLALRSCKARVRGSGIDRVIFRSALRVREDRGRPFGSPVGGRRLRARVQTDDGRVVTLDRRLPARCR
jgi:N-acetylglucosamine-6-sulfatase